MYRLFVSVLVGKFLQIQFVVVIFTDIHPAPNIDLGLIWHHIFSLKVLERQLNRISDNIAREDLLSVKVKAAVRTET